MGGIQSNVTKTTLSDFNNFMNSAAQSAYSTQNNTCTANNYLHLNTGLYGPESDQKTCTFQIDGTFNINQVVGTYCTMENYNQTNEGASFSNFIGSEVKNFIQQDLKNKNGWFATAFSISKNKNITADSIATAIQNQFNQNEQNTCSNYMASSNNMDISLCGYFAADYNINQAAVTQGLTSCVNKMTMDTFTSNADLNTFWQDADQALANKNDGVESAISSLLLPIV
jgi:hypothetical protein